MKRILASLAFLSLLISVHAQNTVIGLVTTEPVIQGVVLESTPATVTVERANPWARHGAMLVDSIAQTSLRKKRVQVYKTRVALATPINYHSYYTQTPQVVTVSTVQPIRPSQPVNVRIIGYRYQQPIVALE